MSRAWRHVRILVAAAILLAPGIDAAVRAILSDWRSVASRERAPDFLTREIQRYEPLIPSLPLSGTVGYLQPQDWPSNDAILRFYLAEYALAPRVIVPGTAPDFVIVVPEALVDDLDGRAGPSRDSRLAGFMHYARVHNGMRIFRRIE
jgi:hypothetical protein